MAGADSLTYNPEPVSTKHFYILKTYFTGTHENAIYDVMNLKADIGAAKISMFYRLAAVDKRIKDELVILAKSLDVPENGLALRKDIDKAIRDKLKNALLNMHHDSKGIQILKNFGAKKFVETTNEDYSVVFKYTQKKI